MKPLLAWLLRQSVPLNILFIGVVAYGLYALSRLPVDLFPNLNLAEVQITTVFPGAAPEEVERLVTEEIEAALRGMDDIEFIAATSLPGRSEVNVKYADDTDYEAVFTDLRLRLSTVQNRLPTVDGRPLAPLINEIEVDEWLPTIQVNLIAADDEHPLDQRALALLAEDLRTRLELIAGVKRVALMGEEPQQFALILDPAALDRHGVGFAEVAAALRDSGQSRAAGTAATPDGERAIRLDTRYRSRGDILSVVVRREGDGRFLTVGDLADPAASGVAAMPDGVILHVNGRNAVACKVLKLGTADARRVRELVVAEVERFLASRADAGVAAVYTLDSTIRIRESIGVLVTSLISGALLVGGTLLIFLNFRAGIVTVIGVLFSFIASLAFFHLTGRSLNELSLLGFVLVVGIIVDDAIIVLENIQRHREHGDDLLEAAVSGTAEVFWPVVSATLTSMASFLPLLLMTGMVGDFFALIPVAVVVALAISLVECLLFLPLHVVDLERLLGAPRIERLAAETITDPQQLLQRDGLIGMLHRIYDRLLGWNL